MYLKINHVEKIATRYKSAVARLIDQGDFADQGRALAALGVSLALYSRAEWRPSKRNVQLIVKKYGVNALWLYTNDPAQTMFL